MDNSKIKVLYIAGANRSGSTIFHNILGQIDGFVSLGEVCDVWLRGFIHNRYCGCGVPFHECPTWHSIMQTGFGGMEQVDAPKLSRLAEGIRIRHFPLMILPLVRQKRLEHLGEYFEHLEKLYAAIQATTSCRVIVDSSKNPFYGYVHRMVPNTDLYVVHFIRDARAVAYSWTRKKLYQPTTTDPYYMAQKPPARSAMEWNARNIAAETFLRTGVKRYTTLRYEEFVQQPKQAIKQILNMLGETVGELPFETEHTVVLDKTNHSVFGNLVRFQTGLVELKLDNQWQVAMKAQDKASVTALTWPLLLRYGYLSTKAPRGQAFGETVVSG